MTEDLAERLRTWAEMYNDPALFQEDPISFPREFARRGADLRDIEVAAVLAAHFAWGRREMIVRDCKRLFDEMQWRPFEYVMSADYRSDPTSIHRTVKWSDVAAICRRLKEFYGTRSSLECLSAGQMRTYIYGQKEDIRAANKKINMLRRWMVRDDGKVDLGLWKNTPKTDLVIPLDVHVHTVAVELGLTDRKQKDITTALIITDSFRQIWPEDPVKGDFALFGYGITHRTAGSKS